MLRDVFYYGKKPNVHPREKYAKNLADARQQASTDHFWIINEFCDYKNFDWDFDFEFLPNQDVWAENHNNVWPSQHQKDSGTWLCPKKHSDIIIYRADVDTVKRKIIKNDNWTILDNIDELKWDFSWHPDPTDPPYVYRWGCKFFPVQLKHVLEYKVTGATQIKYMTSIVELLPETDRWIEYQQIDKNYFDLSWRPNPMEPPYIYVWGNKYIDGKLKPTLEYHAPGANDKKYMPELLKVLPEWDRWVEVIEVDKTQFDFSWRPDPLEPNFIYVFGNEQYDGTIMPTLEYHCYESTIRKYITDIKAKIKPNRMLFEHFENCDGLDYSWRPDPTSPPYIYAWGNQWNKPEDKISVQYAVAGATEYKFMAERAIRKPCMDNWIIPPNIDITNFDFSWEPSPADPAYIYEFGTQWQKTGGPKYVVNGATETKYVDFQKVKILPSIENWTIPDNLDISGFDFSWHPDSTSPPYIYHFATQWALTGGPIYKCIGATEVKYLDSPSAIALPNMKNWQYDDKLIDVNSFDFSWHPYIEDQPYIYKFGTQHQKTGGPTYITPGALSTSPIKYIDIRILKAKRLPNKEKFAILNNYKIKNFDYSWHPDETEDPYIYIFGNTQYPGEIMPTIEYVVQGAKEIKYVNDVVATLAPDMSNWEIPENIDVTDFDFSWKPNPKDPPFIYQFGTQWQKTGGPKYIVSGGTQIKYIEGSKAKSLPNKKNWLMPKDLPIIEFDYSWHPDETEEAYIYVFGTQWQLTAGPKYIVEGATEYKYMDVNFAKAGPTEKYWQIPTNIVIEQFDYSWHPHPDDPTFIYEFGTQWYDRGGPKYVPPEANKDTPIKYIDTRIIKATLGQNKNNWHIPKNIDVDKFDFSWIPHPNDPPFIYQFGTQWQETGGPKYVVNGAGSVKYVDRSIIQSTILPSKNNWEIPDNVDVTNFDFSWHPDSRAEPYIYQFGTLLNRNDGPKYITPNNKGEIVYLPRVIKAKIENNIFTLEENNLPKIIAATNYDIEVKKYYIKTNLEDLIDEHPTELFWALNPDIDYSNFDFDWRPESIRDMEYVQVFGSPASSKQTFFVSSKSYLEGNTQLKFIEILEPTDIPKPDLFYVDRGNKESQIRFEKLKEKFSNIQKTRFLNSWVDTINRCINRSTTELCWILNSELDYSNFNFDYYPNLWQMKMVHIFGTQWNHWGTTFMVNRETFSNDTKYIKVIEHLNNLNFVKDRIAHASTNINDVVFIDHGNTKEYPDNCLIVPYENDYLTTFKNILKNIPQKKDHFIWIRSSICDYSSFDFTYVCDPFARDQLHVFPSNDQKFGDTFLVDVNKLREIITNMNNLKDFDKINYNQSQRVKRLQSPIIISDFDTHVASVTTDFNFPYATFITKDNANIEINDNEPMSLWDKESKNIMIKSTGGTCIIVPKEAKNYVETQLYDYPYIKTSTKLVKSNPLDIVFLSNGEPCAEENYEHLLKVTKGLTNKIVRIDGINGRVQAYQAAAKASDTPWMFTVFAKLKINAKFDFNWQPDRLQIPKHYMFLAKNPVNGLIYGHQGMIAYNKDIVLNNDGYGLDFTMDSPNETVEILSGIATYNTDPYSTWRTAFREVIKLKQQNTEISLQRMNVWLTKAEGNYSEYSLLGAKDAIEYYDDVHGDVSNLKLSYEWEWLNQYYKNKYNK